MDQNFSSFCANQGRGIIRFEFRTPGENLQAGECSVPNIEFSASTPNALPRQNDDVKLLVHTPRALVTQLLQLVAVASTHESPAIALQTRTVAVAIRTGSLLKQARPPVLSLHGARDSHGADFGLKAGGAR
jgi:hypothetical protein